MKHTTLENNVFAWHYSKHPKSYKTKNCQENRIIGKFFYMKYLEYVQIKNVLSF